MSASLSALVLALATLFAPQAHHHRSRIRTTAPRACPAGRVQVHGVCIIRCVPACAPRAICADGRCVPGLTPYGRAPQLDPGSLVSSGTAWALSFFVGVGAGGWYTHNRALAIGGGIGSTLGWIGFGLLYHQYRDPGPEYLNVVAGIILATIGTVSWVGGWVAAPFAARHHNRQVRAWRWSHGQQVGGPRLHIDRAFASGALGARRQLRVPPGQVLFSMPALSW